MKRLILSLLVGVGVLLPFKSLAIDWYVGCQIHPGAITKALTPGQFACLNPITADRDADNLLDTTSCDNIDVFWFLDQDGSGTESTGTVQLEVCPFNAGLNTKAKFALGCRDYGDVLGVTEGLESNLGLGGALVWANIVIDPTQDPQLVISCNGPTP